MKKSRVFFTIAMLVAMVSCGLLTRPDSKERPLTTDNSAPISDNKIEDINRDEAKNQDYVINKASQHRRVAENNSENEASAQTRKEPKAPNSRIPAPRDQHYDTDALNRLVIDDAKLHGTNPEHHRKLLRRDPDGTRVYRALGQHIIVDNQGKEWYLPDEI